MKFIKQLIIACILLLISFLVDATTLTQKCGDQSSFTFMAFGGPLGMGQVVIVDSNNAQVGTYSQSVLLIAGTTLITIPRVNFAVVRIRLTWPNGFVSFSESTNVICSGLPLKLLYFDLNKYTNTLSFQVVDETNVAKYRIKQSTDFIHWTLVDTILPKQGYYTLKLK